MRILFIGDIVAAPGINAVKEALSELLKEQSFDLVVANVENLDNGRGITEETLVELQTIGINFFTSGDHVFRNPDYEDLFSQFPIIRPANFPEIVGGEGYKLVDLGKNGKVLIINLQGRTFINEKIHDPFTTVSQILHELKDEYTYSIVDFHAEATSEKAAMGFYLDGRVHAILGTHTHVPTSDTRTLPNGSVFVSDVGMCGNIDSVLGVKKDIILKMYLTGLNQRFEWESTGNYAFRSVIIDTQTNEITRYDRVYSEFNL